MNSVISSGLPTVHFEKNLTVKLIKKDYFWVIRLGTKIETLTTILPQFFSESTKIDSWPQHIAKKVIQYILGTFFWKPLEIKITWTTTGVELSQKFEFFL